MKMIQVLKEVALHFLAGIGFGITVLVIVARAGMCEIIVQPSNTEKEELNLLVADELRLTEVTDSTVRVAFPGESVWTEFIVGDGSSSIAEPMLRAAYDIKVTLSHQEYAEMLLEVGK